MLLPPIIIKKIPLRYCATPRSRVIPFKQKRSEKKKSQKTVKCIVTLKKMFDFAVNIEKLCI